MRERAVWTWGGCRVQVRGNVTVARHGSGLITEIEGDVGVTIPAPRVMTRTRLERTRTCHIPASRHARSRTCHITTSGACGLVRVTSRSAWSSSVRTRSRTRVCGFWKSTMTVKLAREVLEEEERRERVSGGDRMRRCFG